jgi:hypothetical protein
MYYKVNTAALGYFDICSHGSANVAINEDVSATAHYRRKSDAGSVL